MELHRSVSKGLFDLRFSGEGGYHAAGDADKTWL